MIVGHIGGFMTTVGCEGLMCLRGDGAGCTKCPRCDGDESEDIPWDVNKWIQRKLCVTKVLRNIFCSDIEEREHERCIRPHPRQEFREWSAASHH